MFTDLLEERKKMLGLLAGEGGRARGSVNLESKKEFLNYFMLWAPMENQYG